MNPSEAAQPQNLPLPVPPVNLQNLNLGGLLGGMGNMLGGISSQASKAPGQIGQGFSNLGSTSHAIWDQNITPFIDQTPSAINNNLPAIATMQPLLSPQLQGATGQGYQFLGQKLNQGLQGIAQATAPEQGGYSRDMLSPQGNIDFGKSLIHPLAILGQGAGQLIQDAPGIENDLMQSFQQGLSTTISNDPDADRKQQDAINKLTGGLGKISEDLFNPDLMHTALRDSFMGSGADEATAKQAADYIAQPLSTIASFAAPGGMGKIMLAQFVAQLMADPGTAIKSFIDLNPSRDLDAEGQQIDADMTRANAGQLTPAQLADLQKRIDSYNQALRDPSAQQSTTGDFVHLFGKTAAWIAGQGSAPTAPEVSKGFNALAYDVGLAFMGLHTAREGGQAIGETRSSFERALTGADPSGAREVISGTANIQQTDQAGATSEASQGNQAPPAGSASSPQTAGGVRESSRQAVANVSTAVAQQVAEREGVQQANAFPLSPDVGPNRAEPVGNINISGEGLNEDSVQLATQAAQHLQQAGLTDVVNNIHAVHNETPGVAGGFSTDHPQSITVDLKQAYQRPDVSEFLADAQTFVSRYKEEDIDPKYADAVTQSLENAHRLMNMSPEEAFSYVVNHEALHSETWARTSQFLGDAARKVEELPDEDRSIGQIGVSLFNALKENGLGQRWLAHDSVQYAIGKDLQAIESWLNGKSDTIDTSHDGPLVHLIEHFNSQLQAGKDLAPHPYSLQAGDNAYKETFYNRERADEAAQIAAQWFDATREQATSAVQSGTGLHPATTPVYARASGRGADGEASNQAALKEGDRLIQRDADPANNEAHVESIYTTPSGKQMAKLRMPDGTSLTKLVSSLEKSLSQEGSAWSRPKAAPIDWLKQTIDQLYDRAQRLGVVNDISDLAAQGKTAKQIVDALKLSAGATKENPFANKDAENLVRAVRSRLGIPSMDDREEFQKWVASRQKDAINYDEVAKLSNEFMVSGRGKIGPATADEVQKALGIDLDKAVNVRDHFNRIQGYDAAHEPPALKEVVDKTNDTLDKVEGQTKQAAAPDWRKIAYDLAGAADTHALAALRGIAQTTKTAFETMDKAIEAKIPADDLEKYATDLSFEIARLRAAHELYTSSMGSKLLDRDHPDFKATRTVARQIEQANASPNEKAQMAALKLGMTLEQARKAMKDAQLGLDHTANNWHPDYKTLLMGELGKIAKDMKLKDVKPNLGLHGIPTTTLLETETLDNLRAARRASIVDFKDKQQLIQDEITKARMRKTVGDPAADTQIKKLNRDVRNLRKQQALEAARMEARIANHPDLHQARIANQPPLTAEEVNAKPDPAAVQKHLEDQTEVSLQKTDQELAQEAVGMNGKLAAPVHSVFDPSSILGDNKLTEDGRQAPVNPVRQVGANASIFSPEYAQRVADLRQYGGNSFRLATLMHDFQVSMAQHFDPSESMFHPSQQFNAFWQRASKEIPWRVDQIKKTLDNIINENKKPGESREDFSRRILRPIDNLDNAEKMQLMSELTPHEAALSGVLNEFWRASKTILMDKDFGKPVLEHYVDNYVPHIVLEDPDGNPMSRKSGTTVVNKWTQFARARLTQGAEGEPLLKTLDALEKEGYKVQKDLAEIWSEHSLSAFKAMQVRQLLSTQGRNVYRSPDGSFVGYPVIHFSEWGNAKTMREFKGIETMRPVALGPGARVLNMFYVHPELASYVERLSNVDRWGDIAKSAATISRYLSGIFKFFQFSINPSHAYRVVSNMGVMSSKFGVDAPFNVWKMYNRANRALLPQDRTFLRRINPLTKGTEDFAINQVAKAEKSLTDMRNRLIKLGIDPDKPLHPDTPNFQQASALYDQLNEAAEKLRMERDHWDGVINTRDKSMASELIGKGLTLPKDIIDISDQGWLSNINEHIPVLKQFHQWMWKDVVWNGMLGMAMHMADQHIVRAARDLHGWNGDGGAREAETVITPQERDAAMRQAVYDAKLSTGLLDKADMSLAWQTYGRAVLMSAPWTLGQMRTLRDSTLGNTKLSKKLGRPDLSIVNDKMIQSGFGNKEARYFDGLSTKMARRLLFSGTLKMAMTMAFAQPVLSFLIAGKPMNMIQNYQKDPAHMFDVWAGVDPATGKDIWLASGFFGWQREMAEYGLSAIKASQESKSPLEVATAPLIRMTNKNNPLARIAIEEAIGIDIGKWMNGWDDPSISADTDIRAIHQALNARGFPDMGSIEDRILFGLRTLAPAPSFPDPIPILRNDNMKEVLDNNGMPIPLYTDLRSIIGQVVNPGNFGLGVAGLGNPDKLAAYIMGTSTSESADMATLATRTTQANQYDEGQSQNLIRNQAMRDLNVAFQHGDLQKVAEIRDANGLTNQQVSNAITWGNSYNVNGTTVTTKGMLSGGGPTGGNKPVTIGDHVLSEDEKAIYEKDISNREVYVQYQLKDNPYFASATQTERASMLNSVQALADRWTNTEWDYKVNGNGQPVSDDQFKELINTAIQNRAVVKSSLLMSPGFQSATPMEQQKMIDSYSTFANTVAWDRLYGNDKSITAQELPTVISSAVMAEQNVKDYLGQTPFYQNAPPEEQQRMLNEYSTFTQQQALNMFTGKLKGVIPPSLSGYVRSTINVEESAKYLLHQSEFYQSASLATQRSMDTKYERLSRTVAAQNWQDGMPMVNLSQTEQAYELGSERTLLGHLMADQAFTDLQNQYGGPQQIKNYADELSAAQKQVRETTVASPRTINFMVNQVRAAYLRSNPQYAAYLQARTNWQRGSELGRLYASLNADDQALAAADTSQLEDGTGVADPLSQLVNNSVQAIQSPGTMALDTVTDPNSVTPYVDMSNG